MLMPRAAERATDKAAAALRHRLSTGTRGIHNMGSISNCFTETELCSFNDCLSSYKIDTKFDCSLPRR